MKEFWNERYSLVSYAYGEEPNYFFKQTIDQLSPGKVFLPGEGEGRNAVYAATKGWEVTAIDFSVLARKKALHLAQNHKVSINYQIGDITELPDTPDEYYDLIGLSFIHLPSDLRKTFHRKLMNYLTYGGRISLIGFSKQQISYNTGGPKNPDMLFSAYDLKDDFNQLTLQITEEEITLHEGPYHDGLAHVALMMGKKEK